jgi:hypothetical protein
MGAVVRALDEATGQSLALKTLQSADPRMISLFEREYHTLASLRHPRVIEVYDFGIDQAGRRFYTMELLEGADLYALAPLAFRTAAAHLRDTATSLALLHARRLVHRDVSPRNIRLDAQGRAKLIDFGALASFGAVREIVGTPPFMAPEVLARLSLDQRSDLFSLGAVGYYLLTKRLPFAIRAMRDASEAHRTPPPPPSTLAPEIPAGLDELILSLLSLDPLGRPSSAAEVIDRLSALAELDAEPLTGVVESHLLSSALVGREREKSQLAQHVSRARRGVGSVVVIEGVPGAGRTRLGSELVIDARIAGVATLRVDALAHPESNASLRALCLALLEAAPSEASSALASHGAELCHAFAELAAKLPAPPTLTAPLPRSASERRVRLQGAFARWVAAVAEQRPLVLLIDDAHALDLDSAGALVLLGRALSSAALVLVLSIQRDASLPASLQQLLRVAARIRLGDLSHDEVERLVGSVFGEVPHRARVSQWVAQIGRGNPGHSLELLQHLVERGLVRYERGSWSLPAELPEHELPRGLEEALLSRVGELAPSALRWARLFALYRGALPPRVCFALLPGQRDVEIVAALDDLVAREFLIRVEDGYRFGRDALRGAVLSGSGEEERRELHRNLANALRRLHDEAFTAVLARRAGTLSTPELTTVLHVASHFERCGDTEYGRRLMREAAVELTVRGEGLAEAVPVLEAAVTRLRRDRCLTYELAPLLVPLALAGTYSDFRLSYRHGEEALDLLLELSGLSLARRLRPWLGGRLALAIGLGWGLVYFWSVASKRIGSTFRDLFLGVIGIGSALLGTYSVLLEEARARSVIERTDMLRFFPARHPVGLVRALHLALFDAARGDAAGSSSKAMRLLGALTAPDALKGVREEARVQLQVGCLTPSSLGYSLRLDGRIERVFAELERLQASVSRQIAAGARAVYHGHRGERAKFVRYHEEMDMLASRAGSTWREDVGTPRQLWSTYVLCEDVMGLRRCAQELETVADEVPSLAPVRDAARACYLAERGMPREALERYGSQFARWARVGGLLGTRQAGAYARILRAAGEHERALYVCEHALSLLSAEEREFSLAVLGAQLELALAHAALGRPQEALRLLDQVRGEQGSHDNPLVHGLHHKVRAQIALGTADRAVLAEQLEGMQRWFRRTDNPALVAQYQRLLKAARAAGLLDEAPGAGGDEEKARGAYATEVDAALLGCRGPVERLQLALELIVERAGAERGYLYLLEPDGLRFAAPAAGVQPPEQVLHELAQSLEPLRRPAASAEPAGPTSAAATTVQTSVFVSELEDGDAGDEAGGSGRARRPSMEYLGIPLTRRRGARSNVVGAVALVAGTGPLLPLDPRFLECVASAIYKDQDVRSVFLEGTEVSARDPQGASGPALQGSESMETLRARPQPSNENATRS